MSLNWTLEELILLIALFLLLIAIIIAYIQYSKTKHRTFLYLTLTWINFSLFTLFEILSYIFLSIPLFQFRIFFIILSGFFLIFLVDSISRYNIDPIKTTIFWNFISIIYYNFICSKFCRIYTKYYCGL